jgi:hypothetical protein
LSFSRRLVRRPWREVALRRRPTYSPEQRPPFRLFPTAVTTLSEL